MKKAKVINVDVQKQEITQNISGFPVACYFSEFGKDTYDFIDWHWHLEFQLCIVVSGNVRWRIGDNQIEVPAGEGIFINSQKIHMAEPVLGDEAKFFCVDFRPDFLCRDRSSDLYIRYIDPVLNDSGLLAIHLSLENDAEIRILKHLEEMAIAFSDQQPGFEFDVAKGVFSLWKDLFCRLEESLGKNEKSSDTRLKEILMFLQNNFSQNISLDDVSSNVCLSRSECCRYFKSKTGQTIYQYLMQYRIRKSLELLANTEMNIVQVAVRSGFSSQSYYTSKFKQAIGCTPGQYRRKMNCRCAIN